MNSIRWQRPKWLPRFLAMPVPEPAQQASRILSIQRNIILPARVMVTLVVFYYLFYTPWLVMESASWSVVLETLQRFFIFYIIFNAVAAILLILRRFPPRSVQWVVFTVGLVDGLLLAGLTLETDGFESTLFWVFPGLIIVNALSIPLATPQIVLNLSLSAFYLGAGLLYITITESDSTMYPTPALPPPASRPDSRRMTSSIWNAFATRLKQSAEWRRSVAVSEQLNSPPRRLACWPTIRQRRQTPTCNASLVADLNHIVQGGPIYDPERFAGVKLSAETSNSADSEVPGTNMIAAESQAAAGRVSA